MDMQWDEKQSSVKCRVTQKNSKESIVIQTRVVRICEPNSTVCLEEERLI